MNHSSTPVALAAAGGIVVGAGVAYLLSQKRVESAEQRSASFLAAQVDRAGKSLTESSSPYFAGVTQYKLILTKEEIDLGVLRVAKEIEQRFTGERIVICGILKGAFVFLTDLCRALKRPYSCYFVEASSYGGGQQQSDSVELLSRIVPSKFEGRKIVLVDELLDNGHTMHAMLQHLMTTLQVGHPFKTVHFPEWRSSTKS